MLVVVEEEEGVKEGRGGQGECICLQVMWEE